MNMIPQMMSGWEDEQTTESGWSLVALLYLNLQISLFKPMVGSSWIDLPPSIILKKAVSKPKTRDVYCFEMQSVLKMNTMFNWSGIKFPTPISDISTFERNNSVAVSYTHLTLPTIYSV